MGAGRAAELLRRDALEHLALVQAACGFEYIRFHGVLHDDMGIYFEDRQGNSCYNWQYLDAVYDAVLAVGMKPFVEFSFMPAALASGDRTIFWWRGNVTPPKDYEKWRALIRAFVEHCEQRYGRTEVANWYFEVWNEPNLDGFWAADMAEYFKLYQVTAEAVKSVHSSYRVGGPATAGNAWAAEQIEFCQRTNTPLDFISTHDYGVEGALDEFGQQMTRLSLQADSVHAGPRWVHEQVRNSPMPGLEIHYTEWNSSYSPLDPVHDSYVNAAFVLRKLKQNQGLLTSMSYWAFSDVFEEASPPKTPFHGGFGLINLQGLRKPAFYAYQFLNRLGATELACDDANAWVCTDGKKIQALFWDYTPPQQDSPNQAFFVREHPAAPAGTAQLEIGGLPAGEYRLTASRVGYRANDVYHAYRDLGSPTWLSQAQVAQLHTQSDGRVWDERSVEVGADGVLKAGYELRQNDVILVVAEACAE